MTKVPPRNCPPIQKILEETSGGTGCVNSTLNSNASGSNEKDAAPRTAHMMHMAA
jgi:hypothetical protein